MAAKAHAPVSERKTSRGSCLSNMPIDLKIAVFPDLEADFQFL